MEPVKDVTAHTVSHEDEDDDDRPMLSAQALEALKELLTEQNNRLIIADEGAAGAPDEDEEVSLLSEDWRLSQFWYDSETAETVAKEVHALSSASLDSPSVACVACPTLFAYLKVNT